MVVNKKVTGRALSIPAGIGFGLGISLLTTIIGCAIVAGLIGNENIPEESIGYGAMTILLLSAAAGSLTAAELVKHRRLLVCMLLGLCYFAVLLLINGLMFGGSVSGVWATALVILAGCGCAALTDAQKTKRVHKRKKYRTG